MNYNHSLSSQPAWTTARCNRLLRPIASRVLLLEKWRAQSHKRPQRSSSRSAAIITKDDDEAHRPLAFCTKDEPYWIKTPARHREIKRKYCIRPASTAAIEGLNEASGSVRLADNGLTESSIRTPEILRHMQRNQHLNHTDRRQQEERELVDTDDDDVTRDNQKRTKWCSNRNGAHLPELSQLWSLKSTMPAEQWSLIEGIFSATETLLVVTASESVKAKGSRSLMSMCLRNVPRYILSESKRERAQDPDGRSDVSSETYDALDFVHPISGSSQNPFQEIVRSHGIHILGEAIADRTIAPVVAKALISLCTRNAAFDEAQVLLDYFLATSSSFPCPTNIDSVLFALEGPKMLEDFAVQSGRYGYEYRKLETLIANGALPIEWIATIGLTPLLNRLLQSISCVDEHAFDATNLITTIIFAATVRRQDGRSHASVAPMKPTGYHEEFADEGKVNDGVNDEFDAALNSRISRILMLIVAIMYSWNTNEAAGPDILFKNNLISRSIISATLLMSTNDLIRLQLNDPEMAFRSAKCLLSHLFISSISTDPSNMLAEEKANKTASMMTLKRVVGTIPENSHFTQKLSSFISSTARCCEKVRANSGQACLNLLFRNVQATKTHGLKGFVTANIRLNEILIDAAHEFAEYSGRQPAFRWAEDVETKLLRFDMQFQQPVRQISYNLRNSVLAGCGRDRYVDEVPASPKADFRWEEGISEWVKKTPRPAKVKSNPKPKPAGFKIVIGNDEVDKASYLSYSPLSVKQRHENTLRDKTNEQACQPNAKKPSKRTRWEENLIQRSKRRRVIKVAAVTDGSDDDELCSENVNWR